MPTNIRETKMLKVYANYGAMYPIEELTIQSLRDGFATAISNIGDEIRTFSVDQIRDAKPSSGSPIGIYWNEMDAY